MEKTEHGNVTTRTERSQVEVKKRVKFRNTNETEKTRENTIKLREVSRSSVVQSRSAIFEI